MAQYRDTDYPNTCNAATQDWLKAIAFNGNEWGLPLRASKRMAEFQIICQTISLWLRFNPRPVMWDLWWTKWHWIRFASEHFGFPLSISLQQSIIVTFVHLHFFFLRTRPSLEPTLSCDFGMWAGALQAYAVRNYCQKLVKIMCR
jgi:hypothetical protein